MQILNREACIYSEIHWQITRQQVNSLNSLTSNEIGLKKRAHNSLQSAIIVNKFCREIRYVVRIEMLNSTNSTEGLDSERLTHTRACVHL